MCERNGWLEWRIMYLIWWSPFYKDYLLTQAIFTEQEEGNLSLIRDQGIKSREQLRSYDTSGHLIPVIMTDLGIKCPLAYL